MIRPIHTALSPFRQSGPDSRTRQSGAIPNVRLCALGLSFGAIALTFSPTAHGQAITVDTRTGNISTGVSTVDRRYQQIKPTSVQLSTAPLDAKTRQELIRILQAEQGFAMRPLPRGHKGLTLHANGNLDPAGEAYLNMVTEHGLAAKPGDGVQLTDVKIEKNKITFMINGGPDAKHRFLRHIQLGTGTAMAPVVQDDGSQEPMGSRLTLEFKGSVPSLTGSQVKALLAPLISFDVKTPIQAFTDTLPPRLKEAILNHNVWVGMTTDMVLFAKGQPERKVREVDNQMPFEEWIYGQPPSPVEFVRINGNRVIRVEIAKVGEPPEIFTKDEVEGLMRSDNTPVIAQAPNTRPIQMGDVQRDPDKQAPAPPPTLVGPGEKLPDTATQNGAGAMKPVQFPKQKADDYPDASRLPRDHKSSEEADQPSDNHPSKDQTSQATTPSADASKSTSSPAPAAAPVQQPAQPPNPN